MAEATCDQNEAKDIELSKDSAQCDEAPTGKEVEKCKKAKLKKCVGFADYKCEEEAPWRTYMKLYADQVLRGAQEERDKWGEFKRKHKPPNVDTPEWPMPKPSPAPTPCCFELNLFNELSAPSPKECISPDKQIESCEIEWPKIWPCSKRDVVKERNIILKKMKVEKTGALPCEIDEVDLQESSEDEEMHELARLKELGHARIPAAFSRKSDAQLVDRASGEQPGLVEGDYVSFDLKGSKGEDRTYANVCLRGMEGMPLLELERVRLHTWKFCLFQAIVALLAKTQFRYKFLWSANIDYIYQHAWMIFLHVGYLSLKPKMRFDDVLVFNYKYSVELELIDEILDVPIIPIVGFKFVESGFIKHRQRHRKELTLVKSAFGTEKTRIEYNMPVHKATIELEKWFNKIDERYTNCIIRTSRFSLAFWQDGSFWYVYNPYRCDRYGFWCESGAASITKLCSRDSLRRHLMLLMLRGYAYNSNERRDPCIAQRRMLDYCSVASSRQDGFDTFSVHLYQLVFHKCQIYNVKLYQRAPRQPKMPLVPKKKTDDPCTFDPLDHLNTDPCKITDEIDRMEKSKWLQEKKITWSAKQSDQANKKRDKWNCFDVVKPERIFVLWGNLHISDLMFAEENRNKQAAACYVICAGMIQTSAPEYWDASVLDSIIIRGDEFYVARRKRLTEPKDPCEPPPCPTPDTNKIDEVDNWDANPTDSYKLCDLGVRIDAKTLVKGRLFVRGENCLWRTLEQFFENGEEQLGMLSCLNICLGVFKHCDAYFVIDARSYGLPLFDPGHGKAYLLRTTCFSDLVSYIVLLVGSPECVPFTLRTIRIVEFFRDEEPCDTTVEVEDVCESDTIGREKKDRAKSNLWKKPTMNSHFVEMNTMYKTVKEIVKKDNSEQQEKRPRKIQKDDPCSCWPLPKDGFKKTSAVKLKKDIDKCPDGCV